MYNTGTKAAKPIGDYVRVVCNAVMHNSNKARRKQHKEHTMAAATVKMANMPTRELTKDTSIKCATQNARLLRISAMEKY